MTAQTTTPIATTTEPTVPPDTSLLDVLGTLYTPAVIDNQGNTTTPPAPLPGWHVNSPWPVAGWQAYSVTPTTPRRVFAGGETHCYTFADEAEFLAAAATADLSQPVPVPQSVTRRQARQALLLAGVLGQVQPAIDAIPDATQRAMVQIEWDDSLTFERHRPTLMALASALGMGPAQLDALFVSAAQL